VAPFNLVFDRKKTMPFLIKRLSPEANPVSVPLNPNVVDPADIQVQVFPGFQGGRPENFHCGRKSGPPAAAVNS